VIAECLLARFAELEPCDFGRLPGADHREGFRYTVADAWLPKVIEWNKTLDPAGRFDAAMKAEGLFEIASAPPSK